MSSVATLQRRPTAEQLPRISARRARQRHYVMCEPRFFAVHYAINAWMDPTVPVDTDVALAQWDSLRQIYMGLGHRVDLIEPHPDLPDMVFAANGALALGGRVFAASFVHPERQAESTLHQKRFRDAGVRDIHDPLHANEGEGDFLVVGDLIMAGSGFRTDPAAHQELRDFFGRPVLSLELSDPRFYHLDTAVAVLDDETIAYYPAAFTAASQALLTERFPNALIVDETDALAFGLNAVSDGHNVILPAAAFALADKLRARGYRPIQVDLSEFLKAGGSVKCTTMELHR